MKITGNKGEWCEFYAFLKIICDRHIVSANQNLTALTDQITKVLKVYRQEKSITKIYDLQDAEIISISEIPTSTATETSKVGYVEYSALKSSVKNIFDIIKSKDGTFFVEEAGPILISLQCSRLTAGNTNKEDLKLVLDDWKNHTQKETGFSIKSDLGSAPTLLNASRATNFTYELKHLEPNICNLQEINCIKGISGKIKKLCEYGIIIEFAAIKNKVFFSNLRRADSLLPQIIAEFLITYFKGEGRKITDLTQKVAESELVQKLCFNHDDIKFKVSQFLKHVALGMVPSKTWNGIQRADGGYIIVKDDGEVICFHIYNLDKFMEYLFTNTKLDTPSSTRHKFGFIYKEDGRYFIDLNLQIRFI